MVETRRSLRGSDSGDPNEADDDPAGRLDSRDLGRAVILPGGVDIRPMGFKVMVCAPYCARDATYGVDREITMPCPPFDGLWIDNLRYEGDGVCVQTVWFDVDTGAFTAEATGSVEERDADMKPELIEAMRARGCVVTIPAGNKGRSAEMTVIDDPFPESGKGS